MDVTVKGNKLIIEAELDQVGTPSKSGDTMLHASTRGSKETAINITRTIDGKEVKMPLILNLNAYTYAKPKGGEEKVEKTATK